MSDIPHKSNSLKGVALMLISSILVCFGQLCWKLSGTTGIMLLIIGFGLYGIGALVMIYAYRFGKLSVLQPVLSMNYVLSTILGVSLLKEVFSPQMAFGVCIIICGVVILGGSK